MSFTPGPGTKFLPYTGTPATFGPLTITGGTVTANTPVVDATQTWNNAATTFTGIKFNVTDTASAAGSLLMDLRVGGATIASVNKTGLFYTTGGYISQNSPLLTGFEVKWGATFSVASLTSINGSGSVTVSGDGSFQFASAALSITNPDVVLRRDAADTLAQRRGLNAQTFNIYNTFTDASNYERGRVAWSGNVLQMGTESAGTGTARSVRIISSSEILFGVNGTGGANWYFSTGGHFLASSDDTYDIGAFDNNRPRNFFLRKYMQMSEMTAPAAPAVNNVRIYAVDNGSGKTQLMALFATGAAQQIAIEP